jgi:hypothetical protein
MKTETINKIITAVGVILAFFVLLLLSNNTFGEELPENWPSYYVVFCWNVPEHMYGADDEDLMIQFIRENDQLTSDTFIEMDWVVPTKKSKGIDACVLSPRIGAVPRAGTWQYKARMCKVSVRGMSCIDSEMLEYVYPPQTETKVLDFVFR